MAVLTMSEDKPEGATKDRDITGGSGTEKTIVLFTLTPEMPTAWHHIDKDAREKMKRRRLTVLIIVLPILALVVGSVLAWKFTSDHHHQHTKATPMSMGVFDITATMPTTTATTTIATTTTPSCPPPCNCQQHNGHPSNILVDCSGLGLTQIPTEYIPPNTTALNMAGNRLTRIDYSLTAYSYLEELNLGNNQIEVIDGEALGNVNLKWLNLRGNNLKEIPSHTFKLQAECDLESYALDAYTHVKGGQWEILDLVNIDWPCLIDLSDNPITKVRFRAFAGSSNFSLFLGHPEVKLTIESSAFDDTRNMIGLHITNSNQLNLAPGSFDGMNNVAWIVIDKVKNLNLSNRLFRSVTNSRPRWLRVSNSHVTALSSDVLSVVMDVKVQCFVHTYPVNKILTDSRSEIESGGIEFLNNTLPTLPSDLMRNAHIGGIFFHSNRIAGLSEGIFARHTHDSSICIIKFEGNKFNVISPRAFSNLRNVVHVSFSEWNLTSIESNAFEDSSDIGSLDIILHDNNAVDQVTIKSKAFTKMTRVQIFQLSKVGINKKRVYKPKFVIERYAFWGLNVEYFAVNLHHFLQEIPDGVFSSMTVKERFTVSAQGLKRIHPRAFGYSGNPAKTSIKYLDVDGIQNLTCNCETGQLIENLKAQNIEVFGLYCTGKQKEGTISHHLHLDHITCTATVQRPSLTLIIVLIIHLVLYIRC